MIQSKIHPVSIKITIYFLVVGVLWILFSDRVALLLTTDIKTLSTIQTLKGWFFIFGTGFFVFLLVNNEINKKENAISVLNTQTEWQRLLISNLPETGVYLLDENLKLLFHESSIQNDSIKSLLQTKLKLADKLCLDGKKPKTLFDLLKSYPISKSINLAVETRGKFLEIHGTPVKNQAGKISSYLLVSFNRTHQRDLIHQFSSERTKFAALTEKYHLLNNELAESYSQLKTYNEELIENKERYTAFIQQTSEAVYRFDIKKPIDLSLPTDAQVAATISTGYLAEYNSSFAQVYQFGKKKNYIGKSHYEVYPENNHIQSQELIRELIQNNFALKDHESIEYDSKGRTRYFINNIVGIIENNKLIRFWGTKLETTKIKEHERALIRAKKLAEESDKLKTAFLANMSHEIRTPLNGILGFSELLCNVDLSDKKREKYFHIIQSSNQQLLRIINDILDISRIQTGQLLIGKEKFSLNALMNDIETSLSQELKQNQKTIDLNFICGFNDGKDEIYTDKDRLYQIITNLANNAIKFTRKGSVTVMYEPQSKNILQFSVTDTGIGISEEYLESIFDQFRQVEEFASRQFGGTGLGLSISKGLVEVLGGYISVSSAVNFGSTFKFTIKYT